MTNLTTPESLPVVVVGAGLAGLSTALHLAPSRRVIVIAKRGLADSATAWAQGGIVGVLGADDSVDAHVSDTQAAGAGIVDERSARFISSNSEAAVAWLVEQGVPFTRDPDGPHGLHLTREGGHGVRRIAHAADATGRAIHETLLARAAAHPNIMLREGAMAVDLVMATRTAPGVAPACRGVDVLDLATGHVETLAASAVVLATGGLGQLYRYSSNPGIATGDGVAIGWRAGCRVANMEFIQFHPTCLHHPNERSFLITEALRGEGAHLVLPDGARFMPAHDPRAELAPRDIVARAIESEMKRHGIDHVGLDATGLGEAFLKQHFPTVHARCLALGIDIARQPIPVVPAAHYSCGGLVTDLDARCDVESLYAVGETACTGLHGANRLASNSLLECVVMARSCAAHIAARPVDAGAAPVVSPRAEGRAVVDEALVAHARDELRQLMWDGVGIVRTTRELTQALARIERLRARVDEGGAAARVTAGLLEWRNLATCAELVVRAGLARFESRGAHSSRDFPATFPAGFASVLSRPVQAAGPSTRIE